jgi:hypothetical protein
MTLTRIVPCAQAYAVWSYACASCSSTFHMVEARTAESASLSERRALPRHNVTISGTVKFGADTSSCMVRDVSAAGARIDFTDRAKIPADFMLITEGSHLPCHLIWRKEGKFGIAFD